MLRALPNCGPFDCTETSVVRVDSKALITVRQNRYSVPVALAGLRVFAAVGAREIIVTHQDRVVARHERLHGRYATRAILDHYLELLARKPGGMARSLALTLKVTRDAPLSVSVLTARRSTPQLVASCAGGGGAGGGVLTEPGFRQGHGKLSQKMPSPSASRVSAATWAAAWLG